MIYGEIKELNNYKGINPNLDRAIDYILTYEYKNGKAGKNVVEEDIIYFNMPDSNAMTKELENGFIEGHKRYIDIHIVIEGHERIGYIPRSKAKIKQEYNAEGDFEEFIGDYEALIPLDNEKFLILFPNEPHAAMLKYGDSIEPIKKVIFKVEL